MRAHWVHVQRDLSAPVEEVFAHLAEHENLAALFGAKVKRLNDGDTERNGVGSRRELKVGPTPAFEETVTQYVPNKLIEYKITKGSPLDGHVGTMKFSPTSSGGTHFDYRIRIASKIPLLAPVVARQLTKDVEKGLAGVPGGR
ncbi:MAG: SRPBCC family protein [Solirubrobacteraceae bacterium]